MYLLKKFSISVIASLLVVCFLFTGLAVAATMGDTTTRIGHTAWSSDYGLKTFWYRPDYVGETFVQGGVDGMNTHDFYAYKLTADYIYPPDVGNGSVSPMSLNMIDSSGSVVNSIFSFNNGTIRSVMLPGDALSFCAKHNYNSLLAQDTGSNKVRTTIMFSLDSSWIGSVWTDYIYTGTF